MIALMASNVPVWRCLWTTDGLMAEAAPLPLQSLGYLRKFQLLILDMGGRY